MPQLWHLWFAAGHLLLSFSCNLPHRLHSFLSREVGVTFCLDAVDLGLYPLDPRSLYLRLLLTKFTLVISIPPEAPEFLVFVFFSLMPYISVSIYISFIKTEVGFS